MDIVEKYGGFIKGRIDRSPGAANRLIRIGLGYESLRLGAAGSAQTPEALNLLNRMAIRSVAGALAHPEETIWVNLFAPVELLWGFGLRPLSIECFSSFMGGFRIEDYFLRRAEAIGMSDTLCSYHKCFLGAADAGILKPPLMSLTTTLACDGNANTFRYLEKRVGVKPSIIDVPYECTDESLRYVTGQLEGLIPRLESLCGRPFDEGALKAALERENEARALQEEALLLQAAKDYPATLTLQMFKLFATHILAGSEEALTYYRTLVTDMKRYPDTGAVKVLWVHLMPYYQGTLKRYLGGSGGRRIIASDFDFDYGAGRRLDPGRPLEALAGKMLSNIFNGPYERKTEAALDAAMRLGADGVIHFCHWGCKQSAGGAAEMKRAFDAAKIPFLILDGDGIDRRNDAPEQIRTRVEAFFEMLAEGRAYRKEAGL